MYYELHNKIQLITVVSSIIIVLAGFLGYNSISNIKNDITKDIQHYKENLSKSDSILISYQDLIVELDTQRIKILDALNKSLNETKRLQTDLIRIQAVYSKDIHTYIVEGIKVDTEPLKPKIGKVNFRDLKTIEGKNLPAFKVPPILNVFKYGASFIFITWVEKDFFEYTYTPIVFTGEYKSEAEKLEDEKLMITEFNLMMTVKE